MDSVFTCAPWKPRSYVPERVPIFARTASGKYMAIATIARHRIGFTPEQDAAHYTEDWNYLVDKYNITAWMYPPP